MPVLETVFNAVCTGIGTGIGGYLATKYAIKHIETIDSRIRKK